jgi:hypothetical protein
MTVTVKNKSALTVPTEEYTARQRKILDAQLAEGLEDIRKGRVSPEYNTVDEMVASLKSPGKNSARQPKTRGR